METEMDNLDGYGYFEKSEVVASLPKILLTNL